jgi:hypothetical protein
LKSPKKTNYDKDVPKEVLLNLRETWIATSEHV